VSIDTHLPTPPNEPTSNRMSTSIAPFFPHLHSEVNLEEQWNLRSAGSNAGSSLPSPPADDPIDSQAYSHDALIRATHRYDFYSSSKASPTSSNEADADIDEVLMDWGSSPDHNFEDEVRDVLPDTDNRSPDWDTVSTLASSSYSDFSDINNAFSDVHTRKIDDTTLKPLHEKTT
jgi:ubiquitin carboxyl-terminal hydrolase 4/11/15